MNYIVESDGSKRYLVAKDSESLGDEEYLFGCEFEFYPSQAYEQEAFLEELCSLSYSDVVVNEIFVPHFKDSKSCMQLKPDISLDSNGLEISVPICSYERLKFYIVKINGLIAKYAYTNNDTGLHDSELFKSLKKEHLEMVKNASYEEKVGFMKLFFG